MKLLNQTKPNTFSQIKFLWASEETGFRHLYLVIASISGSSPDTSLCPRIISRVPLTSGDWEVVNRQVINLLIINLFIYFFLSIVR